MAIEKCQVCKQDKFCRDYGVEGEQFEKRICEECFPIALEPTGRKKAPYCQYPCSFCSVREFKNFHFGYGACKSCLKTVQTEQQAREAVETVQRIYGVPYRWKTITRER